MSGMNGSCEEKLSTWWEFIDASHSHSFGYTRNFIYWHKMFFLFDTFSYFLDLGWSLDQTDTLNTDWSEPHETGKRHSDMAAQGRCLSKQERRWEQRAQTSGLPGRSERTERWTSGQDKPDQICWWIILSCKIKVDVSMELFWFILLLWYLVRTAGHKGEGSAHWWTPSIYCSFNLFLRHISREICQCM